MFYSHFELSQRQKFLQIDIYYYDAKLRTACNKILNEMRVAEKEDKRALSKFSLATTQA